MDEDRIVQHEVNKKVCDTALYILSFATAFLFSKTIYEIFKILTRDRPKKKELYTLLIFTVVVGAVTVAVTYFIVKRIKKETIALDKAKASQGQTNIERLVLALKR
jgi:cell division protein FtsL